MKLNIITCNLFYLKVITFLDIIGQRLLYFGTELKHQSINPGIWKITEMSTQVSENAALTKWESKSKSCLRKEGTKQKEEKRTKEPRENRECNLVAYEFAHLARRNTHTTVWIGPAPVCVHDLIKNDCKNQ